MGLVQRFAARRYLRVLRNADLAAPADVVEARTRLQEAGAPVLSSILEAVAEGCHHPALLETMLPLITTENVDRVVAAMANGDASSADFLERALSESTTYDAGLLFDLLETSGSVRTRIERVLRLRCRSFRWDVLQSLVAGASRERLRVILSMLETRREPPAIQIVISLLESQDAWARIHAIRFLASGGDGTSRNSRSRAAEPNAARESQTGPEGQGRNAGRADDEAVASAVARCLRDREPSVRRAAVTGLGNLKARPHLASLCQSLRDSDLKVSSAAIEALVAIGDPGAVRFLVDVLKDDSEYARRGAVEVLNEVATPEAIADLVHALQDEDWWVRVRAADALGALGGDRVVEAVLALVRSEDVFVRRYAIEILNSIPSERSVPALLDALSDTDWWVRERAIDALGKTKDPRGVSPLMVQLRADPEVAPLVLGALVRIGDATALAAMLEYATVTREDLREAVRKALRDLARTSSDLEVRKGAARALSEEGEGAEWGRAAGRTSHGPSVDLRTMGEGDATPRAPKEPTRSMAFRADGATRIESRLPELGMGSREGTGGVVRDGSAESNAMSTGETRSSTASSGSPPTHDRRSTDSAAGSQVTEAGPSSRRSGDSATTSNDARADGPPRSGSAPLSLFDFPNLPEGTWILDRYRVMRKIGEGGFGYVYLVQDQSIGEEVILKVLAPQISMDESMIKRFVHELKYNRRIVHPNVIRLYDFLELNPGHAISMEYFPSEDLGSVLARTGAMEADRLLRIAHQLYIGLKAAHDSGIVHRDIKPPNILIGEGDRAKIVDFGLAAVSGMNQSRVTKSGILVGTPQYMAPEQIRGNEIDHRTDIYALGALLYECLCGAPPFESDNPVSVLMMHLTEPVPSIKERVPNVPVVLEWLIQASLAKDPAERPQTIDDVLTEIEKRAA